MQLTLSVGSDELVHDSADEAREMLRVVLVCALQIYQESEVSDRNHVLGELVRRTYHDHAHSDGGKLK